MAERRFRTSLLGDLWNDEFHCQTGENGGRAARTDKCIASERKNIPRQATYAEAVSLSSSSGGSEMRVQHSPSLCIERVSKGKGDGQEWSIVEHRHSRSPIEGRSAEICWKTERRSTTNLLRFTEKQRRNQAPASMATKLQLDQEKDED